MVSPAHLVGMNSTTSYPNEFESIMTLSELAARLGVTTQTIYDLRSQGHGPRGFRVGLLLAALGLAILITAAVVALQARRAVARSTAGLRRFTWRRSPRAE